jgi:site-specific DNA-methyltransferase (adenine-specific)
VKTYAEGKRWKLYQGDVLRLLPALREGGLQVDGVITDPPYSSGGQFRGDRAGDPTKKYCQTGSDLKYLPSFGGDNRDMRSLERWCVYWMADLLRLTRPGGIVAVSIDWRNNVCVQDALQIAGWTFRGELPWIKPDARPQLGRFGAAAEYVAWGSAGALDDQERAALGAIPGYLVCVAPRNREHVTEKPQAWGDWLVRGVLPSGVVLDCFTGSGVVGQAAIRSGRSFVGCEIQAEHLDTAARRLEQAESEGVQAPLLAPVVAPENPGLFGGKAA